MHLPSEAITRNLLSYDPTLDEIKDLFDYGYTSSRKKLFALYNLIKYETVPDNLLNYVLYSKGIPLYFNYTTAQKRNLLTLLEQDITGEAIGSSGSSVYTGTLKYNSRIVPGSVTITDGTFSGTDVTPWILKGTGISTGYINYNTGEYKIVFTSNTGTPVTADYSYYYDLNSKRYIRDGLDEYIRKIVLSGLTYVDVNVKAKQQMFLEFRLYGFPNTSMRNTAGEQYGDQVGYIGNIPQLSNATNSNTTAVLLYISTSISTEIFTLLKQTLGFELKNIEFTQSNKLQVMLVNGVNCNVILEGGTTKKVTKASGTSFVTLFAAPGDKYIGIKHTANDFVSTYRISSVQSSTDIILEFDQDVEYENGVVFYAPVSGQISDIEL